MYILSQRCKSEQIFLLAKFEGENSFKGTKDEERGKKFIEKWKNIFSILN
jgi:hypothetical protein